MHLDSLLADEPLIGGLEPRLGDHHLRTLTIIGFPSRTFPGLLDELNRLAFPYRWATRAVTAAAKCWAWTSPPRKPNPSGPPSCVN